MEPHSLNHWRNTNIKLFYFANTNTEHKSKHTNHSTKCFLVRMLPLCSMVWGDLRIYKQFHIKTNTILASIKLFLKQLPASTWTNIAAYVILYICVENVIQLLRFYDVMFHTQSSEKRIVSHFPPNRHTKLCVAENEAAWLKDPQDRQPARKLPACAVANIKQAQHTHTKTHTHLLIFTRKHVLHVETFENIRTKKFVHDCLSSTFLLLVF